MLTHRKTMGVITGPVERKKKLLKTHWFVEYILQVIIWKVKNIPAAFKHPKSIRWFAKKGSTQLDRPIIMGEIILFLDIQFFPSNNTP